jgi:Fic family protein
MPETEVSRCGMYATYSLFYEVFYDLLQDSSYVGQGQLTMSKNESKDAQAVKNELTNAIRENKRERKAISTQLEAKGSLTIPELANATGLPADKVLQHILVMMKSGEVAEAGEKDGGYAYRKKEA